MIERATRVYRVLVMILLWMHEPVPFLMKHLPLPRYTGMLGELKSMLVHGSENGNPSA